MKILVDTNLTPRWIGFLRSSGFEALHWSENGPANAPDEKIMAYAARHGFVVMTHTISISAQFLRPLVGISQALFRSAPTIQRLKPLDPKSLGLYTGWRMN